MSERLANHRMPAWVKVMGIIAIVLVALLAGLMLFGDGHHGPGRHIPRGETDAGRPASDTTKDAARAGDAVPARQAPTEAGR